MKKLIARRHLSDAQGELLKGTFLDETCFDTLITEDTDAYTAEGEMLFRFRKGALDINVLKLGVESFKDSIEWTEGRGSAAGKSFKRPRKDGSISNTTVSNFVQSGNVGFMDASAMVRYCRKTAFAHNYFEKFTAGVPFVEAVDKLYSELCPEHYARQAAIARGTNRNYVIGNTSFTTVTVNKNFQTAVHKDSGDFPRGFGNLCCYRQGDWTGSYFCLPEFRIGIDLHSTDMLFVDVHRWHGNTPFIIDGKPVEAPEERTDFARISFVMYYREYMINCKQPADELQQTKMEQGGFLKL